MSAARPTRREIAAAETRREILRAARELFAANGYAGTSIQQIAEASGVAVQTIYSSVGSKAALVLALNDLIDEEAGVAELAVEVARDQTGGDNRQGSAPHASTQRTMRRHHRRAALGAAVRTRRRRRRRRRHAPPRPRRESDRHQDRRTRRSTTGSHPRTSSGRVLHDDFPRQLAAAHPNRRVELRRRRNMADRVPDTTPPPTSPPEPGQTQVCVTGVICGLRHDVAVGRQRTPGTASFSPCRSGFATRHGRSCSSGVWSASCSSS